MKYEFELSDIVCGNWIIKNSSRPGSKDFNFAATVVFKIGFEAGSKKYTLCNALTDGCVFSYESKEKILESINSEPLGFRPLSKEELIIIVENDKHFLRK